MIRLILPILLVLSLNTLSAQTQDSLLTQAKTFAYNGNYEQSITILKELNDIEAQQLLARVYAWSHQYEKSLMLCKQLNVDFPEVVSNYHIAATTALWGGQWAVCSQEAEKGIALGGDPLVFGILQLKALMNAKKIIDAEKKCLILMTQYPRNDELKALYEEIRKKQFQKELLVNHTQDHFTLDSSRWKSTSVILKNKTKYGPVLLSANHSKRFDLTGLQGELEFYPKIDSNYYAYLDLGFSSSVLFPNFRNGISVFRTFNKGFEAELGYRNLHFKEAGNVWFYLGSVTKYFGNNTLTYRFTSIHSPDGKSATHGLKLTHYLDDALSYVSVELGSGTNARDYQAYSSFKPFSNINSRRIQIDYKQQLTYRMAVRLSGAYEKALYIGDREGERWTWGLGLNVQF